MKGSDSEYTARWNAIYQRDNISKSQAKRLATMQMAEDNTGTNKNEYYDILSTEDCFETMKRKSFRHWLTEKWYQHCDEILTYSGHMPEYPLKEYFHRYKWWLKALYRKENE